MVATAIENSQQIVVFSLGDQKFGLEIDQVKEIIRLVEITPMPRVPEAVTGMINLRGKVIPVIDLHRYLELPATADGANTRIIIVDTAGVLVGFRVDAATDVIRIAADNVEPAVNIMTSNDLTSIKGVLNLDGHLITLLDIAELLNITANLDVVK